MGYNRIIYRLKEFFDIPYHLRKIRWFFQRGIRGYSDKDLWSFDDYLSKVISKGLRQLAIQSHGCPHEFYDEKNDSCKEWAKTLIIIAEGFEAKQKLTNDDVLDYSEAFKLLPDEDLIKNINNKEFGKKLKEIWKSPESKRLIKEHEEKWEKGIKLFKKYYTSFWD